MEHRRDFRRWLGLVAGLALALPAAADDPVYRWVDRDGRVNYGSAPPSGVVAEVLGERGNLSVVPPLPLLPRPSAPAAEAGRIAELEAALEHERALREQREQREAEAADEAARLRAECEERYREPCDEAGRPLAPRYAVVPRAAHGHGPQLRPPGPPGRDPGHRAGDKRRGQDRLFKSAAEAKWSAIGVVPRHRDDRRAPAPQGWRWSGPDR
jgi:hypothetical protein